MAKLQLQTKLKLQDTVASCKIQLPVASYSCQLPVAVLVVTMGFVFQYAPHGQKWNYCKMHNLWPAHGIGVDMSQSMYIT